MARHLETQRRRALDIVFEAEQKDILVPGLLKELLAERQVLSTAQVPIQPAGARLVELVSNHLYEIDELIEQYSKWGLRRLAALDRAILRLGLAEICFGNLEIGVAVKEYSAIVRELGDERSVGFITAIFNRAGKEHRAASQAKPDQAVTATESTTQASDQSDSEHARVSEADNVRVSDSDGDVSATDAVRSDLAASGVGDEGSITDKTAQAVADEQFREQTALSLSGETPDIAGKETDE